MNSMLNFFRCSCQRLYSKLRQLSQSNTPQGEAIDDALEGEDDEQKIDDQVALVIAELGIDLLGKGPVRSNNLKHTFLCHAVFMHDACHS